MTLIFCDGMDSYTAVAQAGNKWTTVTGATLSTSGGRFGGGMLQPSNSGDIERAPFASSYTVAAGAKIRMGFWFKAGSTVSVAADLAQFQTAAGGGVSMSFLRLTTSGFVALNRIGASGTALITGTTKVDDGQWHWIEVDVLLASGATGTAAMWIDSISQGSASSVQTLNAANSAPINGINIRGSSWGSNVDDVIVWDDQGTDFNSSNIGPQRISTLVPSGDGATLGYTPNSGTTHYTQVSGGYGSANYVQDGGTGTVDLYTYPSLSYSPTTIRAVVANMFAQNPGTATANILAKLRTGGTTISGGTTFTMGAGGVNGLYQQAFYKDASAAAWTAANVNAMQVGVGD